MPFIEYGLTRYHRTDIHDKNFINLFFLAQLECGDVGETTADVETRKSVWHVLSSINNEDLVHSSKNLGLDFRFVFGYTYEV